MQYSNEEPDDLELMQKGVRVVSEGAFENGEQTAIFLEEAGESVVFRLFRAREGTGDPEQQAIHWLGRARSLCRSARGELRTCVIPSKDEEAARAVVSGQEIETNWPNPRFRGRGYST